MANIIVKECAICGKKFPAMRSTQKYCGKACRFTAVEMRNEALRKKRRENSTKGQLCWRCGNATGQCSWSRCLKPVEGWVAEKVMIKDGAGDMSTYKIKECPLYIPD